MRSFRIGVVTDNLLLGTREGVRKAAALGAEGVQLYTVSGDMSPEQLTAAGRAEFKAFCADLGLAVSAVCGDMGGGFRDGDTNAAKVERSKAIVDLAVDLGTDVVTTHIGVVPEDPASPTYQVMLAACRELGECAASRGATFAIETGPETARTLKGFLDDVASKGIGVNLDPANLVMVTADDPVEAAHTLRDYIVHTHAKDGVQLHPCDPVQEYHGTPPAELGPAYEELPLGEGAVDWDAYLDALGEIGYSGFLTVEREVGNDRVGDVRSAIEFLRGKIE